MNVNRSRYKTRFDAGHRYTLSVTWDREGWPVDQDIDDYHAAVARIDALVAELANRDLAKMLEPFHPSVYGVASFFLERLRINVPISKVEVHESDGPTAIIEYDSNQ